MRLLVQRADDDDKATIGDIYINGDHQGKTLEDTRRAIKVKGETRIPAGIYDIKLRAEGGMHSKYAARYPWHRGMLHLQNVPGFTYVYLHSGNYHTHTDGCILVGTSHGEKDGVHCVWGSREAYDKIGHMITSALLHGEAVTIEVRDEDRPDLG